MKSLDSLRNRHGKLWLNVGAGAYAIPDCLNIDNSTFLRLLRFYPVLRPFIGQRRCASFEAYRKAVASAFYVIHDCRKPLPFPPDSVDHILTSHFLEHMYPIEAEEVIRGFHKILKPEGTLHVIVPDLACHARQYVENIGTEQANVTFINSLILTARERPSLATRWREFIGGFGLFHRWMYDEAGLRAMLERVGFSIAKTNTSPTAGWRSVDNASQVNLLACKKPTV